MSDPRPDVLELVIDMAVQGIRPDRMRQTLRDKRGVDLSPEIFRDYLVMAGVHFTQAADFNRTEAMGLAVERLQFLYNQALAKKDFKTALAAQKELDHLLRLKPEDPDPKSPLESLEVPAIPCRS